jgi:hypothetical protein
VNADENNDPISLDFVGLYGRLELKRTWSCTVAALFGMESGPERVLKLVVPTLATSINVDLNSVLSGDARWSFLIFGWM